MVTGAFGLLGGAIQNSLPKKFRADNEYDEHFNALVAHQKETNAVEKDETMEEMKPSKPVSNSATDDLIEVTKQSDSTLDSWDLEWYPEQVGRVFFGVEFDVLDFVAMELHLDPQYVAN